MAAVQAELVPQIKALGPDRRGAAVEPAAAGVPRRIGAATRRSSHARPAARRGRAGEAATGTDRRPPAAGPARPPLDVVVIGVSTGGPERARPDRSPALPRRPARCPS